MPIFLIKVLAQSGAKTKRECCSYFRKNGLFHDEIYE